MRVLLDAGVFIHSRICEPAISRRVLRVGTYDDPVEVVGIRRKPPRQNSKFQRQADALFTVGRLIREGRIEALSYWEIDCEIWRGSPGIPDCNALRGCAIKSCPPALPRTKFRQTVEFLEAISKGGKKDREGKADAIPSPISQIAFFEWLLTLNDKAVALLVSVAPQRDLSAFDIESLKDLGWFKSLCQRVGREIYPDIFHLWTAERNGLDALLTLDGDLPNLLSRVKSERRKTIEINTAVLKPLELVQQFGISEPDSVPLEFDRFYHLHELPE